MRGNWEVKQTLGAFRCGEPFSLDTKTPNSSGFTLFRPFPSGTLTSSP